MKNAVRVMSVALVVVMVGALLVSCGTTLVGTYSNVSDGLLGENGATYEFKAGGKVTVTTTALGKNNTREGTYKINDGKIIIEFEKSDGSVDSTSYDFIKGDNYIKIGGIQYDKVEK